MLRQAVMRAPSNLRPGDVPVQVCPNCDSTQIVCATLTDRFIYLRCEACGEVWSIPERRQTGPRLDMSVRAQAHTALDPPLGTLFAAKATRTQ
jgi:hypothetical protein